jgi:hypothetical protein
MHSPLRTFTLIAASLVTPGILAAGPVDYHFSMLSPGNGIDPIAFTIETPDFIVPGVFAITPFQVTRGSFVWTFTQADAQVSGTFGCIQFGTAAATFNPNCGGASPFNGGLLMFFFDPPSVSAPNYLPAIPGSYALNSTSYSLLEFYPDFFFGGPAAQVDVSVAPEPGTTGLSIVSLAAGIFVLRRKASLRNPRTAR